MSPNSSQKATHTMPNMEKHLFNLKIAAKELQHNSKKCDKEEKAEKAKAKKAIQKGNTEAARIHAENAIRQKHQSINLLRTSARVDAVASRVQTAVTMNQISALMNQFERHFETLDVQTVLMEDTMGSTSMLTTPQNEVDTLLREMADEAGLDLSVALPPGQTSPVASTVASAEQVTQLFPPQFFRPLNFPRIRLATALWIISLTYCGLPSTCMKGNTFNYFFFYHFLSGVSRCTEFL
ncbi:charged multivesicular body protein 1b-like isoform X3 [Xiphophorus couchianus]|uniref:charged multivesicular body protein 1b-like isoform X3 n=1 Tax=Xiphophorus couchianus TaxID=32473 RepID=UPI001016D253|nr:charged multivesicular body protein 1b-like isoform X3 [Xiphophorus couchianus]